MQAEQIADTYASSVRIGAPSTLADPHTVQQFLAAIADGNYRETAARLAGISKQTFYNWLKRAEHGDEAAIAFVDALEKAEATAEAGLVANVRRASTQPQFWAAGMTLLERKSPEKWGRRQDDSSAPKVVIQFGVQQSDVKVNVIANYQTPSELGAVDSLCKSPLTVGESARALPVIEIAATDPAGDPAGAPGLVGRTGAGDAKGALGAPERKRAMGKKKPGKKGC